MTRFGALCCSVAAALLVTGTGAAVQAAPPAPTVTSVTPAIGLVAGGARVTVTGTGFTGVRSVVFGKATGSNVRVQSASQLQVTAPAHYAGTVHVQVVTGGGRSRAVHVDEFTYRYAPAATGTPAVVDTTATSVALAWRASVDPDAVVEVHRATGSTPPATPSRTTLVTTLPVGTTQYRDTGLAADRLYAYALFTKADGLHSRTGPAVNGRTARTARPAAPVFRDTGPSVLPDCLDGTPAVGLEERMSIVADVETPDSTSWSFVHTRMQLLDLGDTNGAEPVELIGFQDDIGDSGRVLTPGLTLNSINLDDLEDGHDYGVRLMTLDDADTASRVSPECRFRLDRQAPTGPDITGAFPPDGVARVGHPATFTMTSTEPTSASGRASGIDHFVYAIGSCSGLSTPVALSSVDGWTATASITYTPTEWGSNYFCAAAVDGAGNRSGTATYSFYVVDASVPARVSAR